MEAARWNLMNPIPLGLLLVSLGYSYFLLTKIPKGIVRLMFLPPVIYIFSTLPWYFPSAFLRGTLFFFIIWMASSKLLLFCFNQGPLIQCQNFLDFILISVLPLRIKQKPTSTNFALMGRYETEQLFDKPYLSTSLRDFWGRRWNRYASDIMRETVHKPIRKMLTGLVGFGAARVLALTCTLVVSGVLHEMLFYYITCARKPTWVVACYYVLQGLAMSIEAAFDKWTTYKIHPLLSAIWTCGLVVVAYFWLVVLPVWRDGQNSCHF